MRTYHHLLSRLLIVMLGLSVGVSNAQHYTIPHASGGYGGKTMSAPKQTGGSTAPAGYGSGRTAAQIKASPQPVTVMPGANIPANIQPRQVPAYAAPTANTIRMPLNPYQAGQGYIKSHPVQYGQPAVGRAPVKPFSEISPTPVISPYMNLYRRDNVSGIDNYNFYVRPALQAQQEKEQLRRELNALEAQNSALQPTLVPPTGATYGEINYGTVSGNRTGVYQAPGAHYGFNPNPPSVYTPPQPIAPLTMPGLPSVTVTPQIPAVQTPNQEQPENKKSENIDEEEETETLGPQPRYR